MSTILRGFRLSVLTLSASVLVAAASGVTLTFDNLPNLPATDGSVDLFSANGGSMSYGGVTFLTGVSVVGSAYRVDPVSGPTFGIPHSGSFFLSNNASDATNGDHVMLSTNLVLTGAWFGQNEYYGFGGGADQITIFALNGATILGSVTFNLPDVIPGQPDPLSFVDTSAFLSLNGITGYQIDRRNPNPVNPTGANWVADDFQFQAVPEPGSLALLLAAGLGLAVALRRSGPQRRMALR